MKDPADFTIEGHFLLGDNGPTVVEYRQPNKSLCWSLWVTQKYIEFSACLDDISMLRITGDNIFIEKRKWIHVAADRHRDIWTVNADGIMLRQVFESRFFDANLWTPPDASLIAQPLFYAPQGNLISDFRISKGVSRCYGSPLPEPA
jgi:hypothetical protein